MKYALYTFALLLLFSICIFSCKTSGEPKSDIGIKRSQLQNSGNNHLPKTVVEAVALIIMNMSAEDKEFVRNTKKGDLIKFHHGWGTGIRNEFGLWGLNNVLLEDTGERHPDDASMVIIEAVWKELQKR